MSRRLIQKTTTRSSPQNITTFLQNKLDYLRGSGLFRGDNHQSNNGEQTTEVLNLSAFYEEDPGDREFLQRYLKLTHCDLFFADAAILVEGNVERLLLPIMIEKATPNLRSACLCILEVGGAFGHRFKALIEFLGITTLIITDLDSVALVNNDADDNQDENIEFEVPSVEGEQPPAKKAGTACLPSVAGAVTSNQTLIQWLPKKQTIASLLIATNNEKLQESENGEGCKVRVTYQISSDVTWNGVTTRLCGRTLEEAFGLENADWCQSSEHRHLGLKLRTNPATPDNLASGLHNRIKGKSFDKTKFALGVLTELPASWNVPLYIKEGLTWLDGEIKLELVPPVPVTTDLAATSVVIEIATTTPAGSAQ